MGYLKIDGVNRVFVGYLNVDGVNRVFVGYLNVDGVNRVFIRLLLRWLDAPITQASGTTYTVSMHFRLMITTHLTTIQVTRKGKSLT